MTLDYDTLTGFIINFGESLGETYVADDLPTRVAIMLFIRIRARAGFDGVWDACDDEVRREIITSLIETAEKVIEASTYRESDLVAARHDAKWKDDLTVDEVRCLTDTMSSSGRPVTRAGMDRLEDEVQYLHRAFVAERMLIVDMMKGNVSEDSFPVKGKMMPPALGLMCLVFVQLINSIPTAKNFVSFGFTDYATGKVFTIRVTRGDAREPEFLAQEQAVRIRELEAELAALRAERS